MHGAMDSPRMRRSMIQGSMVYSPMRCSMNSSQRKMVSGKSKRQQGVGEAKEKGARAAAGSGRLTWVVGRQGRIQATTSEHPETSNILPDVPRLR